MRENDARDWRAAKDRSVAAARLLIVVTVVGGGVVVGEAASAGASDCSGGTATDNTFFLTSGAQTTNLNDAWRFKVERTSGTGNSNLTTKNKHSGGNGWDSNFTVGPTGRWSTGNFAEVQDCETVKNLDGTSKNYLYSRSCTQT